MSSTEAACGRMPMRAIRDAQYSDSVWCYACLRPTRCPVLRQRMCYQHRRKRRRCPGSKLPMVPRAAMRCPALMSACIVLRCCYAASVLT
eukprot:3047411-Rhodomonas_salina.1